MKAKVKETGEVLKIADYSKLTMESCDSYGTPLEYAPEEVELIDDTHIDGGIDWEARRFELVKAAMWGFNALEDFETNAENVVGYADAVLAEYRKGEKQ